MPASPPDSPQLLPTESVDLESQQAPDLSPTRPGKAWRRLLRLVFLGLALWIGILLLTAESHLGMSAPFEQNLQYLRFRLRSWKNKDLLQTAKQQIVLVPIGDSTIEDSVVAKNNEPTLLRDRHARIIDSLSKAGAKCITFDLLFDLHRPEDKELAAATRRARARGCEVIWAAFWQSGGDLDDTSEKQLKLPNSNLRAASPIVGHTSFPVTPEYPIADRIQNQVKTGKSSIPALSVVTYRAFAGARAEEAIRDLPVDADGTFTINFLIAEKANENVVPQVPYEEVYRDFATGPWSKFFRGKVVIVGDTTQLHHDYYRTPVKELAGMEVHAHALAMLMSQSWIKYVAPWKVAVVIGGIICLMIGIGAVVRSWGAILAGIILLGGYFGLSMELFADSGLLLPTVAPVAAGALALVGAVAERSWFQDQAKARLDDVVNQYVSDQVSAEGAPRGRVTLVFSDIEDSSELSSHLGEKFEVVRTQYFHLLREAAKKHHGFEVETAGDSLFLIFQHAVDALDFAVASQRAVRTHRWPSTISRLRIRIGVHTGEPYIRRDRNRLTYRGPDTNKAARVTAYASGDEILLTQETLASASVARPAAFRYEDRGEVVLKGVGTTHLYSLAIPEE